MDTHQEPSQLKTRIRDDSTHHGSWWVRDAEIHAKKVDLFIYQQGVDTTTPAGKALFGMMGVFAEFKRSIIQERVKAGIKRVRGRRASVGEGGRSRRRIPLSALGFWNFGAKDSGWA